MTERYDRSRDDRRGDDRMSAANCLGRKQLGDVGTIVQYCPILWPINRHFWWDTINEFNRLGKRRMTIFNMKNVH